MKRYLACGILTLFFWVFVCGAALPEPSTNTDKGQANVASGEGPGDEVAFTQLLKGTLLEGFVHAFVASISVIIVSELGDKTFFIAAIMAMRHPRVTVLAGAMLALFIMHVLSASLGGVVTTFIPRKYTYYASAVLFAIFGIKMMKDGLGMSAEEGQEEYEEVQADLRKKEEEEGASGIADAEAATRPAVPRYNFLRKYFSRVFLQTLTLTFLAEWGDRSQITTIILATKENIAGVIIGGALGHFICTALAVLGGRFIAQKISVRTVTLVGSVVFILFAISALLFKPTDS